MLILRAILEAAILFATPLLIAAIGELIVEHGGMVNISIEGMMLIGAMAAALVNAGTQSAAAGIFAAIAAAVLLGLLFATVTLVFAADQIVTGAGINLLALGASGALYERFSNPNATIHGFSPYSISIFALILSIAAWIFLRLLRPGLELSAIGESPQAADAAGVPVSRRRLYAILFGAACAGLAGAYLSTIRGQQFVENMTEGRGFLALAIVIFGRWSAPGIVGAALFFGLVRAGADQLQLSPHIEQSTAKLLNILPYALSIIALATVTARSKSPAALGQAYVRA
ncbi:MAG TPA: ABC transporter permease [Tepidisphaeraceae bacterium]|jgi:simple sugar transport system permease protein|nr:ABC transporter permease [Tepidisphaeraceae bacterium]